MEASPSTHFSNARLQVRRHGWRAGPYKQAQIGLALFDIEQDIGETTNLVERYPAVVAKIQALADRMRSELGDSLTNQTGSEKRESGCLTEKICDSTGNPGNRFR